MEEIINETCYIMHNPAYWGMGSGTDCYFITESNLKRLIVMELKKRAAGESYSTRYTGTWEKECCIKGTQEETIASIINTRLRTSSTDALCNDLVKIPGDVKIMKREQVMQNKIFRVFNQFQCASDVIARKAHFIRYYVDLTEHSNVADLEGGKVYEFTGFEMEGVLLYHFQESDKVDECLENNYFKIKRLTEQQKGKTERDSEYLDKQIEEARWIIAHLEEKVEAQDHYYSYVYQQEWSSEGWESIYRDSVEKDKRRDHTQYVYYALLFDLLGCIVSGYEEGKRVHRYDELFQSKCNVEYLLCRQTNIDSSSWETVDAFYTLRDVFGYD